MLQTSPDSGVVLDAKIDWYAWNLIRSPGLRVSVAEGNTIVPCVASAVNASKWRAHDPAVLYSLLLRIETWEDRKGNILILAYSF